MIFWQCELQGLRPKIPRNTHPMLVELINRCWRQEPSLRPEFSEILEFLVQFFQNVCRALLTLSLIIYFSMSFDIEFVYF